MTISAQAMASYAKEADRREMYYGGNTAVAALKAFKRYHGDARWEVEDLNGRLRWMGQKQARVYAIVHRLSVSGERMTMMAIAKEALCVPSTVSRSILKFQSWGMFAIDVVRGRNGGISVRLRTLRDGLQSYAEAAWQRIKSAADRAFRARINVASTIQGVDEGFSTDPLLLVTLKDATFNEAWANAERNGRLLAAQTPSDASLALTRHDRDFDPGRLTAENVVAERVRLAIFDPEGEEELDEPFKVLRWYHGIRG